VRLFFRLSLYVVTLCTILLFFTQIDQLYAQPQSTEQSQAVVDATAPVPAAADSDTKPIKAEIDWIAEMFKGGLIVVAQLLLSVVGVGVGIQRLIHIRQRNFAPIQLVEKAIELGEKGRWNDVHELVDGDPSVVAKIIRFIVDHRHNELQHIQQGAGDIGVREMRHELQRVYPLAVVGSLEPLLGLLGTMIGMIEAFALVAIYGDEGGASLLADSIAKALITTAVGLAIAIPSMGFYYYFKQRVMGYMADLETSIEAMIDAWFLKPLGTARARAKQIKLAEKQAQRSVTHRPNA
jgi:biopolymer transport protein ExbB